MYLRWGINVLLVDNNVGVDISTRENACLGKGWRSCIQSMWSSETMYCACSCCSHCGCWVKHWCLLLAHERLCCLLVLREVRETWMMLPSYVVNCVLCRVLESVWTHAVVLLGWILCFALSLVVNSAHTQWSISNWVQECWLCNRRLIPTFLRLVTLITCWIPNH